MLGFETYRKTIVVFIDIILIALSYYLSFLLRFEGRIPSAELHTLFMHLPWLLAIRLSFFYYFDLYRGIWQYASIGEIVKIAEAVAGSTAVFVLLTVFTHGLVGYPRSTFIIDMLLILFLVGGSRFFFRLYREIVPQTCNSPRKRTLIIGAGYTGNTILREIKNTPELGYNVVGIIDDDPRKQHMKVHGVRVLGTRMDIVATCVAKDVAVIIIAIPSADKLALHPIVQECEKTQARIKMMPAMKDLINGRVSFSQIREVQIEDLLGRDVVEIDTDNIRKYIAGKRVLVTGAGGSIGSEICRQVIKYDPRTLILLGRGEFSIYSIHKELESQDSETLLVPMIGDIINRRKLEGVFKKYLPEIVFHAAANKHVPLLESNPDEAILNNIIGTRNVIEVAEENGVEKVVCISTDKAADPVSVMGCSKKIAEVIIQSRNHPDTRTMGVRFGNVLGSRGSVIPLFKKQIAVGGPLTVTHLDMVRYFMTIPEASQLVLQAGAIGACGDIFLLDMGEPVRIAELARRMIKLSGFEPDKDIHISYSGLRPGEKLIESLTGTNEKLFRTSHPKIFCLKADGARKTVSSRDIEELCNYAINMDESGIRAKLQEMIPAYRTAPRT